MKKRNARPSLFRRIPLADLLLLAFMAVLLMQSGHNLFVNEMGKGESTALDVVIRTTAAAIFGYFISTGAGSAAENTLAVSQTKIGFALPEEGQATVRMEGEEALTGTQEAVPASVEGREARTHGFKLVTVGLIGLASLGLLIMARNCGQGSPESMAALSQLRDFVSGSVGYLIAHDGGTSRT